MGEQTRYWGMTRATDDGGETREHLPAEAVSAELASWSLKPEDRTYDIFLCDCDVCSRREGPGPDRCTCGGELVPDVLEPGIVPLTETCATCGQTYDVIPF